MKWKIICAALLLTNAATAALWFMPKKTREYRADRTEVDARLADGWKMKTTVTEDLGPVRKTFYILTKED